MRRSTWTDAFGRPELIADPELLSEGAHWRINDAPAPENSDDDHQAAKVEGGVNDDTEESDGAA